MNRVDLINDLLESRNLKTYLEIGVDDPNSTFNHIKAETKVGVDPYDDGTGCHQWNENNREKLIGKIDSGATFHKMTSDEYFEELDPKDKFDIIFIDGLHIKQQVERDYKNALKHINRSNGLIIIDDICPNNEYETKTPPDVGQPWRGNVYEFWADMRGRNQKFLMVACLELGVGVIDFSVKKNGTPKFTNINFPTYSMSWEFYNWFRVELMNEKPTTEARALLGL